MERRRHDDAIGKRAGRAERVAATHAVAQGAECRRGALTDADRARRSRARVSRITIAWLIDAIMPLNRSRSGPSVADDVRRERRERRAVVEIRQRDDVAVRGQPLRHARQLGPDAERVHVEHDGRPGTSTARPA